jgi:hypothetical protein
LAIGAPLAAVSKSMCVCQTNASCEVLVGSSCSNSVVENAQPESASTKGTTNAKR